MTALQRTKYDGRNQPPGEWGGGAQVGLREGDDWLDPTVSTKRLYVTPLADGHCCFVW